VRIAPYSSKILLMTSLLVLLPFFSFAQRKTTEEKGPATDISSLSKSLTTSLQHLIDSALRNEQRFSDSLASALASATKKSISHIVLFTDSLIASARDSLDIQRRDTLRSASKSLQQQLLAMVDTTNQRLGGHMSYFATELSEEKKTYSACDSCEAVSDFNDRYEEFRDFVANVREFIRDTTSTLVDDRRDNLQDRYEAIRDSLADLRDKLIENRLNQIDYERYAATHFAASVGYSSHASYRGRDNGVPQQMIAPAVGFHHSSGFGIEVSTYWLDQTPKQWDDVAVAVSYEFTAGSRISGGLSYSHFWFSDSSRSAQSVFNNALDASLSLNVGVLTLSVGGALAMGDASEFTFAVSVSHVFEMPLTLYNRISLEPALTAAIGEQNSTLTTLRKGPRGKKVVGVQTQTSNTFGILDYEVELPLTIILGKVTISPSLAYIKPVNVIDQSTTEAFFDFAVGVSLALR
jgi:hypothetical protein